MERGSPGVVLKRDEVRAFFIRPARISVLKRDIQRFLMGIKGIYPGIAEHPLRWTVLKDKNWSSSWRRFFSPQKVGKSLWITPPWVDLPPSHPWPVVVIEPGMAFGTGTHPTTRACLEFLEEITAALNPETVTALDVGTGSGILAIALAKMGVKRVLGIDTDPIALKTARLNARRNGVGNAVRLSGFALGKVKGTFTIVVANLTAETIIGLACLLEKKVSANGYLILSGILRPKTAQVLRQFAPGGFALARQISQKEWTTLLLKKRG